MTAYGSPADREQTRAAGFDLHLVKPASPGDLIDVLRTPRATRRLSDTGQPQCAPVSARA